jgi:PilZ domain
MILDKNLTGRSEKRLPIMVVVRLSALATGRGEVEEQTYTDNLSSGGVRVCSLHRWQPGDQVKVAPVDQGPPMQGEVIYCEKSDQARFFVGLKFHRGRAPWRILQRYGSH